MEPTKDPFSHLNSHESCYMCNGFYGPNFNEPVCSTCHLFLFPDELSHEQPDVVLSCIKDDGNDSGNDCECPQDRDSSLKTPPLGSCSYNNLAGGINNGPPGQRRRRRRHRGEDVEDEAASEDSLTSDEELPIAAGPGRHFVFNVHRGGRVEERLGREIVRPLPAGLGDPDDSILNHNFDLSPDDENNSEGPALQQRLEELSCYSKSQHVARLTNQNEGDKSIHSLPPEVLIVVFSYLDDLSLCSVSKACSRWSRIIQDTTSSEQWRYFVYARFPLFNSRISISNWYSVYAKLVDNSPCYTCLQHMIRPQISSLQEDNTWRLNRLHKEYNDIKLDPPDGIQAQPLDNKRCHWMATIAGPVASPYEGGIFFLYLRIPFSYPMNPPKVKFITRIFHPNVSRHGDVGLDCIQHDWSIALTLNKVLISVQSLLTDPYCMVCMEPSVGDLYVNNRYQFEEHARNWTRKYAILENCID